MGRNATTLEDPEGIEAVLKELKNLPSAGTVGLADIKTLETRGSELFASRARQRRFDSHQLLLKVDEIEGRLQSDLDSVHLRPFREALNDTRAMLLREFPTDAQRSLYLNPDNARAIYDLCRFMQDKIGSYDRQVVIRNFEHIIELRKGDSEKDGDFLNANINLTVLNYEIGNEAKARCYSAQTIKVHLARGQSDYDYLRGTQSNGEPNEPEFRAVTLKLNPNWDMTHQDCSLIGTL